MSRLFHTNIKEGVHGRLSHTDIKEGVHGRPEGHSRQLTALLLPAKRPGRHWTQPAAPAPEYDPNMQASQATAPSFSLKVPARQLGQVVLAGLGCCRPWKTSRHSCFRPTREGNNKRGNKNKKEPGEKGKHVQSIKGCAQNNRLKTMF